MSRALLVLALVGCAGTDRGMVAFAPHFGAGRIRDRSPTGADNKPSARGANLTWLYRIYPSYALGLGLDSTELHAKTAEGGDIVYLSYGAAIAGRLDTGRFALTTTAAYYVGDRSFGTRSENGPATTGPGVGLVAVARIGLGKSVSLEAGPFVKFFHVRMTEDEMTTDYDERGTRITNLAFGVSIGIVLGGPPVGAVEESF